MGIEISYLSAFLVALLGAGIGIRKRLRSDVKKEQVKHPLERAL
jgi:hypothetical protein